ncbi:MAG: hypothetical protein ACPK85_02400 [Methanosarcina sp.]
MKNILVQLDYNYLTPFLRIKRSKYFNKDILPRVEAPATEQERNRSDIIRDILYAKLTISQM